MSRLVGYLLWLVGCTAFFIGLVITIAALVANNVEIKHDDGHAGKPGFAQRMTVMIIAGVLGALLCLTGNRLAVYGRRLSKRRFTMDRLDLRRPYVLLLRSFVSDGQKINSEPVKLIGVEQRVPDVEEKLVDGLSAVGRMIAIGSPSDPLPHLGADRCYLSGPEWQMSVLKLIKGATLVVIRLGTTPGVLWEVRSCLTELDPKRILLFLPATLDGPDRKLVYSKFRTESASLFKKALPENFGGNQFMMFTIDWAPKFMKLSNKSRAVPGPAEMQIELAQILSELGYALPGKYGCAYKILRMFGLLVFSIVVLFGVSILLTIMLELEQR